MVRTTKLLGVFAAILLALIPGGCGQLPSTARPLNGAGLTLLVPRPETNPSSQFNLGAVFKYRVSSGSDAVTGSVDLTALGGITGTINIPLPYDGHWLVSGEWVNLGVTPLFIGADLAQVQGSTPFDLELGQTNTPCYKVNLADVAAIPAYPDLYTFDTNVSASSTLTSAGDIQCLLNPGPSNPSLYFQAGGGSSAKFAYLGNGDWVNFTQAPSSGGVFHGDSLSAKRAALGSSAVMEVNDVYLVELSSSVRAWLQVQQVTNLAPATSVTFDFRLNRHGYTYLKFDVTAYGDANCNTSGTSLY